MWYVIVFFMTMNPLDPQPLYVFTNPSFATEEECRATLTHQPSIYMYTQKLNEAYQGELPGRIRGVNCINEDIKQQLDDINQDQKLGTSI